MERSVYLWKPGWATDALLASIREVTCHHSIGKAEALCGWPTIFYDLFFFLLQIKSFCYSEKEDKDGEKIMSVHWLFDLPADT